MPTNLATHRRRSTHTTTTITIPQPTTREKKNVLIGMVATMDLSFGGNDVDDGQAGSNK